MTAAHGEMPVPAPATLKLLEGLPVLGGPPGSGELVTPTGAALLKILSAGEPPAVYEPSRSGYGAGTKDFPNRANVLRMTIAEAELVASREVVIELAADIDDMTPEYVAAVAEALREAGALDVSLLQTIMKRGRPGTRVEVLSRPETVAECERILFRETTTLGVRRRQADRVVLDRSTLTVEVLGHSISVKVSVLPDGTRRAKPEFVDVHRVSLATGRPLQDIFRLASTSAERA